MSGVLVIQTAFLGDVVLTTPLMVAAAGRFHPLPISSLVIPSGAEVLGYPADPIEGVDEIIVYDKRDRDSGLRSFFKLARHLKERRFDVALVPHRSSRSAFLAYMADIPLRVGFDQNSMGPLFTHRVSRLSEKHEVERNLALLEPFGGPPAGFEPKLTVSVTEKARDRAAEWLEDLDGAKLKVGISPGSVWGTKQWMPEGFAKVMDVLAEERNASFVIVGGPKDAEIASEVESKSSAPALNLAGNTSIKEMIAVIEVLDLFVTNDTGPMHVAAALDVPIVAVFGATTPELGFAPYTENARIVQPPDGLKCRPCSAHGPKSCPEEHFRCMRDIKPAMVIDALNDLL